MPIRRRFAAARLEDAGDQPAAGDGAARRRRARQSPTARRPACGSKPQDKAVALLPGPPREMKPMVERIVGRTVAAPRAAGSCCAARVLKIAGRSESRVEELTQPVYSQWRVRETPIETTILATPGQIELHLSARGRDEQALAAALDRAVDEIAQVLPNDLFSRDGQSLEEVVGALLRARGWRIALAESCTGGLATSRLTDVAGSSALRRSQRRRLQQRVQDCAAGRRRGAHCAVTARSASPWPRPWLVAIRERAGVDVGVGITGIAGPGGGSEAKPVGTVCIAVVTETVAGADIPLSRQSRAGEDVCRLHGTRYGPPRAPQRAAQRRLGQALGTLFVVGGADAVVCCG